MARQGPPAFQQPLPLPLAVSSGKGSPSWSPERDDDDDLSYMENPSPLVHTPTPPVCEQRPVTPQRPIRCPPVHLLGWRQVGTHQNDLDNPDGFKWVPEHLTPRKFLEQHKEEYAKVREWHFRDLMHLPKATQEEWKIACKDELEALCWHNVFKLTDLPKGRKTIGCRWVFDIKSDGCNKARPVAQGFSQVEGIDFNELFSPVVRFESV